MNKPFRQARYQDVAQSVRDSILSGELSPGARLPSEAELCRRHGVSRGTAVKAIEQLVAEGIVTRRQGLGSFVTRPGLRRTTGRLASFSEAVTAQGHRPMQRLIRREPASVPQARALGLTEPALRLVRLRLVDGEACAIHVSLVPAGILDRLPPEEVARLADPVGSDFSLYRAFEDLGHSVERAVEQVGARLAREDESRLLGLGGPAALLAVLRQSFDTRDRLIEVSEAVYLAGRYHFEMELDRGASRAAPHRLTPARRSGQGNDQQGITS